jgi:2-polyprenyl-3-methyl-5-hydroxy-6-metoxy-1,4-benzoquinol methylase
MTKLNNISTKEVPCPLCGSIKQNPILTVLDYKCGIPGRYTIGNCLSCGLCYLNPRPTTEDILSVYPEVYFQDYLKKIPPWIYKRIKLLKKLLPQGKLLEIGCSAGHFLNMAQKEGYSVSGIEMDPRTGEFARNYYGIDVQITSLEKARLPESYYDLVVLFDVFEHFVEPRVCLNKIFQTLIPGGYVIIKVPNFGCFESKLFEKFWFPLDVPRHLLYFSQEVLTKFLMKFGFLPIRTLHISEPHAFAYSLIWSILYGLFRKESGTALAVKSGNLSYITRNLMIKNTISKLISYLWSFPGWVLAILKHGNSIIAVAQKPRNTCSNK